MYFISYYMKFAFFRISALELLMYLGQVYNEEIDDLELRCSVADIFMFFLPGLASGLKIIALEDEKSGHKIVVVCMHFKFVLSDSY